MVQKYQQIYIISFIIFYFARVIHKAYLIFVSFIFVCCYNIYIPYFVVKVNFLILLVFYQFIIVTSPKNKYLFCWKSIFRFHNKFLLRFCNREHQQVQAGARVSRLKTSRCTTRIDEPSPNNSTQHQYDSSGSEADEW